MGPNASIGGMGFSRQASPAYRHRGKKGHRPSFLAGFRGMPSMATRGRLLSPSSRGIACKSPWVYGWAGAANISPAVPRSTTLPAYIT